MLEDTKRDLNIALTNINKILFHFNRIAAAGKVNEIEFKLKMF